MAKKAQPATRREEIPSPNSLLIRGGHVIDPATNTDGELDLLLRDGRVAELAPRSKLIGRAVETLDARGLVVDPGFIDLHVHLREPGQPSPWLLLILKPSAWVEPR